MRKLSVVFFLVVLLGTMAEEGLAIGRVYARVPNWSNSPIYNLRIKSLWADVQIRDQLAVTHVDQVFANDNSMRLEGFYVFQLPEGAQVHEMYLWINGIRVPYTVKKRADAVQIYQEIVTRTADPAILEQLGSNLFKLRIFPFDAMGTRRIEIVYSQPLSYYSGSIQYVFPLDMTDYSSAAIENAGISIDLKSQIPISTVTTSADATPAAVNVTKIDSTHYTIAYGLENATFSKDFNIRGALDRRGRSMVNLTYAPPHETEDPYFVMWSALPDTLYGDSVQSRELTFIADISSSMEGQRLQQLKDALLSFIDLLTVRDRFNIVSFSTGTVRFRPDLVAVTPAVQDSARLFVQQLVALGLTNFESALHDALLQSYADSVHSAIVFFTDGLPSWGETTPDSLLARTRRWNTMDTKIFTVGVGQESDYTLLRSLASQNGGAFTPIAADDSIYVKVKELYRALWLQELRSIAMDYGSAGALDIHPSPLPDVFAGDQLMTTGRFTRSGPSGVVLTGIAGGQSFSLQESVDFPGSDTSFFAVARYWGAQKIQSLLTLIQQMGEQQELVDQVVTLSMKYSVLTPYTAFLIVEPASGSTEYVENQQLPLRTTLLPNYPNPFNPSTRIAFTIGQGAPRLVTVRVYDMLGRLVRTLLHEVRSSGTYELVWNARDDLGRPVASGMYMARLSVGEFAAARTMTLLK